MQTFVLQTQRVKKVVLKHQKIVSMPLNFKNIFSLHKGPQERRSFFFMSRKIKQMTQLRETLCG